MRKIMNRPDHFVDESLEGILLAHGDRLRVVDEDGRALVRADSPLAGQVGIVTGGGSGHLPLFLGYVGAGLCSGVAIGNVFSSPSAETILAATKAVASGQGVLYLYGNYGGDVLNFDLAGELADAEGIATATVLVTDDVASAPKDRRRNRRGIAGMLFAFKCAGAAAARGYPLARVKAVTEATVAATYTMGVGLAPTILPEAGTPTFLLEDGEMEIGIGIHGEPGSHRGALLPADQIAERLTESILADADLKRGASVAVLVNGLGSTPLEELYIIYRQVHKILSGRGITVRNNYIGEYATSLEMAGASVSVLHLTGEMPDLIDAPASTPFLRL